MKQKSLVRSLVAAGALSVAALGSYATFSESAVTSAIAAPAAVQAVAGPQQAPMIAVPNFTAIVQQHGPAVVNISVTSKLEKTSLSPDQFKMDPDDPFSQFFRQFPSPRQQMPERTSGATAC